MKSESVKNVERYILAAFREMCCESLSPSEFESAVNTMQILMLRRELRFLEDETKERDK